MPQRMAGYIGRTIEQHGLPVYSNVIYLRPNVGQTDPGCYIQERPGYRIEIHYQVIRLIERAGQRILDEGPAGLIPLTPLMQRPAGLDAEAWLRRCVHAAQAVVMDETRKANYLTDLAILSGLVYTSDTILTIISEETMYESSIVQYFTEKGLEQGLEQGGQEFLLDVLALRFPADQVRPLADRIAAIDDVQRLKHLHRAAIQVPTLEDFSNLLDAPE